MTEAVNWEISVDFVKAGHVVCVDPDSRIGLLVYVYNNAHGMVAIFTTAQMSFFIFCSKYRSWAHVRTASVPTF